MVAIIVFSASFLCLAGMLSVKARGLSGLPGLSLRPALRPLLRRVR